MSHMGAGQWLARQQLRSHNQRAADWGERTAYAIAAYMNAAIAHELAVDTTDARTIAGVTTGLQDAAAGLALGASVGGVWGAAIGAAAGAIEGGIRGSWPSGREGLRHQFQEFLRQVPPAVKARLWPHFKTFANLCRLGDHNQPLGRWRLIDDVNVNLFGSAQIIVAWMMEDLYRTNEWYPRGLPVGARTPFNQLPDYFQYALAIVASRGADNQSIGHVPMSRAIACVDDFACVDPNQVHDWTPELKPWMQYNHDKITCGQIRAQVSVPDITVLPKGKVFQDFLVKDVPIR